MLKPYKELSDNPIGFGTSGLTSAWQVLGDTASEVYTAIPGLTVTTDVEFEEYIFDPLESEEEETDILVLEAEWQALAVKERKRIKRLGYSETDVDSYLNSHRYGK